MPIIVQNLKLPLGTKPQEICNQALKSLGLSSAVQVGVYKSSLDARKRTDIHIVASVYIKLESPEKEQALALKSGAKYFEEPTLSPQISTQVRSGRVVVAGFGPAGMFCALVLAELGYKPIVLERGAEMQARVKAVEGFWNGGDLDTSTNVQFGEGGAGTFSDGKLTTRIGDPLCRYVLRRFVQFGAPEEILHMQKPHIGTDKLRGVVTNIRKRIIELGGEVRFLTKLEGFKIQNGGVVNVKTNGGDISASALVLAIGHSARDTFEMLAKSQIVLQPKPFSVGVRVEHTQKSVDESLYGALAGNPMLPKGEYQLSHRNGDRAVYTFCMCPGGLVVASASEENTVVTNGMSYYDRSGPNANSAVAVSVSPADFGQSPLAGVNFQREIETKAFKATGSYKAPFCTVGDFLGEKTKPNVTPSYMPGVEKADLTKIFPSFVNQMLVEGFGKFSRQMQCFGNKGAVITAPETRTSSPVKIPRNEELTAIGTGNLYPCGEGAGYAGGITSASVDGIRVALKIAESFAPNAEL